MPGEMSPSEAPHAPWHALVSSSAYEEFFQRIRARGQTQILDLSAGYDLVSYVAAHGFSVVSVDAQHEILAAARADRPIRVDRPEASAAAILCVGTFSLLPREAAPALASEMERVLAPGGLAFVSFAPLWSRDSDDRRSVRTFFDRSGNVYRRDHGQMARYVVYQTREIETLFRRLTLVSVVTQVNGVRRLLAAKRP
jgi:SAM-dependent methyltransferase